MNIEKNKRNLILLLICILAGSGLYLLFENMLVITFYLICIISMIVFARTLPKDQFIIRTLALLLGLITLLMLNIPWSTNLIGKFRNNRVELKITATGNKNELSQGSEVWIDYVKVDGNDVNLNDYTYLNSEWIFSSSGLYHEGENADFTMYLNVNETLEIGLGQHAWSGISEIWVEDHLIGQYDLYYESPQLLEIDLSDSIVLQPLSYFYYVVVGGIWLILYTLYYILFSVLNKSFIFHSIYFVLPCIISYSIYFLAFYPALCSSDIYDQWAQALGIRGLSNWHPVIHTLVLRLFSMFTHNFAYIVILQIVVAVFLLERIFSLLYKKGVPCWILMAISFFMALYPANGTMLMNIWKDIPYALSILGLTYEIMLMVIDREKWEQSRKQKWFTVLALVSVSIFRHNGIVPFIATIIAMIFYLKKKGIQLVVISVIALCLIKTMVYPLANASDGNTRGAAFSFLAHNLGTIYVENGDLDNDDLLFLESIMPLEVWEENYNKYTHNDYAFSEYPYLANLSKDETQFLKHYIQIALKNIPLVCHDIFQLTNMIWEFSYPKDSYIYIASFNNYTNLNVALEVGQDIIAQEYSYQKTQLTNYIENIIKKTSGISYANFFWRFGWIHLSFLICTCIIIIRKRYMYLLVFVPITFNVLSLFISMISQSYRYLYSSTLVIPAIVGITILALYQKKENGNVKNIN